MIDRRWDSERVTGRLLILAAAILWSTSGFFAKAPIFVDWPIEQQGWAVRGPLLAFWRALFANLILWPLVRRPRWNPRLIPAALIFTAMNVTFLTAMTQTTAANAIWLQNTAPVWVFLVGVLCWGETMHARDAWLLLFAGIGLSIILGCELRGESPAGIGWGLLAGLTYAGVVLSLRWLRDEDSAWLVAVNHLVTALLLLPYVARQDVWPSMSQFGYLAGFGMLQMGLPYWLFALGLQRVASHEAAGIALLEPVLVPVWVFLAWHHAPNYESPAWWTLLGGSFILAGLLLRYLGAKPLPGPGALPPRGPAAGP